MKWPSSQLKGFITRVVNPSQTLPGLIEAGVVVLVLVQVLLVFAGADAVRRSARSELVRWPASLTGSGCRLVPLHRPPSSAAAEYGLTPEVAGTPVPGSASMSSLGRWPSLDRRLRRGSSAPSARWRTRRGKRRPTRHRPGHR